MPLEWVPCRFMKTVAEPSAHCLPNLRRHLRAEPSAAPLGGGDLRSRAFPLCRYHSDIYYNPTAGAQDI